MATVHLTPYGVRILQEHYRMPLEFNLENITGYKVASHIYTTELWHLMHIFGKSLYMGARDIPFVLNQITLEHHE